MFSSAYIWNFYWRVGGIILKCLHVYKIFVPNIRKPQKAKRQLRFTNTVCVALQGKIRQLQDETRKEGWGGWKQRAVLMNWRGLLTWLNLRSYWQLNMLEDSADEEGRDSEFSLACLPSFPPLCSLYWHISPFQKGLLSFLRLCLELQIVAFVNNVHKEGLLNSCWVIFVLHFAPSVNTGTTPTPFPDEPNLAVKAENVSQLHPIFRTCNEEKM